VTTKTKEHAALETAAKDAVRFLEKYDPLFEKLANKHPQFAMDGSELLEKLALALREP
jgi:hypothetical protein